MMTPASTPDPRLRRLALALPLSLLAVAAAHAQAAGTIQASVQVVDPAPSAAPMAVALRLADDPRLFARDPARRESAGASVVVEKPRDRAAPARRITIIHW